jgi:CRISPR-associated protein Csx10
LRYEGTISEKRLASLTGISANTFKLLYHSASMRRVMGWQDLWGLPRMHEYAIDAGSVFLFTAAQPLDELAQALFTLEEQGIGQRRAEGFGRICISDPFHRERELQ